MSVILQQELHIRTPGRALIEITDRVHAAVDEAGIGAGLCHLFLRHTSASLLINENADPDVRRDLETFLSDLVPDGDRRYRHGAEGPDDMPAHVRSMLTQTSLSIPIIEQRLHLGAWQGIFVWEHRHQPHRRTVALTLIGG